MTGLEPNAVAPDQSTLSGVELCRRGRFADALPKLMAATAELPCDIVAMTALATAQAHLGQHAEAIETCATVIALDAGHSEAKALLQQLCDVVVGAEARVRALEALAKAMPENIEIWRRLGHDLWALNPANTRPATAGTPSPALEVSFAEPADGDAHLEQRMFNAVRRAVEDQRRVNRAWAEHLAAQHNALGYLDCFNTHWTYSLTQQYLRDLNLFVEKYGAHEAYPEAVAEIPDELHDRFSMGGLAAVAKGYANYRFPAKYLDVLEDRDLDGYLVVAKLIPAPVRDGHDPMTPRSLVGAEPLIGARILAAVDAVGAEGRSVAVFGSLDLCLEAHLVHRRARVTSVRVLPFENLCTKMAAVGAEDWQGEGERFDVIVAAGSLHRLGLGLFGDSLDPDADIKAMAGIRRRLKPDGVLVLAVPVGLDCIVFNTGRIYGPKRLPLLLGEWTQVSATGLDEDALAGCGEDHAVIVLRPIAPEGQQQ